MLGEKCCVSTPRPTTTNRSKRRAANSRRTECVGTNVRRVALCSRRR